MPNVIPVVPSVHFSTGVKRDLCKHWERRGFCDRGAECGFAHGAHEQRGNVMSGAISVPPVPGSVPPVPGSVPVKRDLCKHFQRLGYCDRGAACGFAHGVNDIGMPNLSQAAGFEMQQALGQAQMMVDLPQKRTLCRHFVQKGFCERGEACGFAHGSQEIGAPDFSQVAGLAPAAMPSKSQIQSR